MSRMLPRRRHSRLASPACRATVAASLGAVLVGEAGPATAQDAVRQVAVGTQQPWPLDMLSSFGQPATVISGLLWGLIGLSVFVVLVITALVIAGVWRGRFARDTRVERSARGLSFIYVGMGFTVAALIGFVVWTVDVMAEIQAPPSRPALTISIIGHQWWWEARYEGATPSQTFTTANEIHLPVGVPVRFEVTSADVIHSFWVPALGGKTDAIPGRTNTSWLEADKPGVYRGQCTEYCGKQHAHMAFFVTAEPPADFEKWRQNQLSPAASPTSARAQQGERDFIQRCGACHTVRGTSAGGRVGPDLTHLMSRQTIAAGELKNNIANLSGWIANPQGIKPGARMPAVDLSGPELDAIRTYLTTLH